MGEGEGEGVGYYVDEGGGWFGLWGGLGWGGLGWGGGGVGGVGGEGGGVGRVAVKVVVEVGVVVRI